MSYTEDIAVELEAFAPFDLEEAKKAKTIALKDMQTKRPKNAKKSRKDSRANS